MLACIGQLSIAIDLEGAREVGPKQVRAEPSMAVARVALHAAEWLGLSTQPAVHSAATVAASKVRLDEEAVEAVGEAVADKVVGRGERPQTRLVE